MALLSPHESNEYQACVYVHSWKRILKEHLCAFGTKTVGRYNQADFDNRSSILHAMCAKVNFKSMKPSLNVFDTPYELPTLNVLVQNMG